MIIFFVFFSFLPYYMKKGHIYADDFLSQQYQNSYGAFLNHKKHFK